MNCDQVREQLLDALQPGSLDQRPELKGHFESCGECARELRELQSTMALMDEWKAPEVSAYFSTRLRARLNEVKAEEAQAGVKWWAWLRTPAVMRTALASALVISMAVGLNLYTSFEPNVKNPVPVVAPQGTAVADLQTLEKNQDLYSEFDLLDDIGGNKNDSSQQVTEAEL
jgi:hypothetical protein